MGVSFDIGYVFGFVWTFSNSVDEKVVENIINFLYKLYDKEFYYIHAQFDKYHKSRKIIIGLRDKRLKTKYLLSCIKQRDIEEKFEEDEYLRNSPFLNYFHEYVNDCVEDPESGFCKQDFYENCIELAEKSWEITERDDITLEPKYDKHYSNIHKIYRFLEEITDELENDNKNIDMKKIWNSFVGSLTCLRTFKWHTVTFVSY